jgi:hypothetical protein
MQSRAYAGAAILLLALGGAGGGNAADSPGCNQARSIVDEVTRQWQAGQVDHKGALGRLSMARDLCPALGEAWRLSYCSASALGDQARARIYRDRAVFSGIAKLECGSEPAAPEAAPGPVRNKYALLVGIGKFGDPSIPPLKFAAKDARDLKTLLVDPRYGNFPADNVTLLVDEEATRVNILKALNKISLAATEDDLVLLFFSSHGSPRKDGVGLQGIGYIVTFDSTQGEMFLNGLEFTDLSEKVAAIQSRRKVTLLDTCYSGQSRTRGGKALVLEGYGVGQKEATLFLSGEGTYVITSSRDNEISFESEELRNGYFTYYLLDALRSGSEPPTIRDVYTHLSTRVRDSVARDKRAAQNPRLLPDDGKGDLRIGVIPQHAQR